MSIIARECLECGEVFEEHYENDTCPFCKGKIYDVIEFTCKNCGQIFEGISIDTCPYCDSVEVEELD